MMPSLRIARCYNLVPFSNRLDDTEEKDSFAQSSDKISLASLSASQKSCNSRTSPRIELGCYRSISEELKSNSSINTSNSYDADVKSNRSSLIGSIAHTTNYFIGVGVLGLPYAFRCSGWFGLPVLVFLGMIMAYSGRLIGRCLEEYSLSTYPDMAEAAFGKTGRNLASLVFYSMLLLDCTLFFVLAQTSAQSLIPVSISEDIRVLIHQMLPFFMAAIMILLTNSFTNMQCLSVLSAVGATSTLLLCVVLITMYSVSFSPDFGQEEQWENRTDTWRGCIALAKSFGVISFSFMGHQVLPSVHRTMQSPSKYPLLMDITFALTVFWYVLVGGLGYLAFGRNSQENVVDNLKEFSSVWPIHTLVSGLVAITSSSKFALASYPLSSGLIDIILNSSYFTYTAPKTVTIIEKIKGQPPAEIELLDTNCYANRTGSGTKKYQRNPSYSTFGSSSTPFNFDTVYNCYSGDDDGEKKEDIDKDKIATLEDCIDNAQSGIKKLTALDENDKDEVSNIYNLSGVGLGSEKGIEIGIGRETGIGTLAGREARAENNQSARRQLFAFIADAKKLRLIMACVMFIVRTMIPITSLVLGTILPDFLPLMSIIGVVFGLCISLVIPLLCYRKLFREQISESENLILMSSLVFSFMIMTTGFLATVTPQTS